jgi:hypothetical protein
MAKEVPPEFYALVDRFIALANEITGEHNTSRVSAVIMFAAARYNPHCMLALDPDAVQSRAAAVDYFVEQYRSMLEDNIDWLAASRDETV